MTTTQPNLVQLAKQGDARAIAALLNRSLQPKGITAKANLKDGCLHVMLEAAKTPEQQTLVAFLQKGLENLGSSAFQKVKVYGKQVGEDIPTWTQEFILGEALSSESTVIQESSNFSEPPKQLSLKERARQGDLSAISNVIKQAFKGQELHIEAEMQWGASLWLRLMSNGKLKSQDCVNIICESLDNIKPEKVTSVRISEIAPNNPKKQVWDKYLAIKDGKFVDNTEQIQKVAAICGIVVVGFLLLGTFFNKSGSTDSTPSSSSTSAQVVNSDKEAQAILDKVTQKYGYSRFIDTWGMGTQGLFLPEQAWNELSSSEHTTLITYAQSKKLTAIVVGKQLAPNNISLDRTVWGD